ncbi:hypothetical protein ACFPJ1_31585 [Kribbella qitaiheensis]
MITTGLGVAALGVFPSYPFALAAIGLTGVGVAAALPWLLTHARTDPS